MGYETAPKRGVEVHYGPRNPAPEKGGEHTSKDRVKKVTWEMNYDSLPTSGDGLTAFIPAGATVVSAKFEVITAFTSTSGTTDLLIGLCQEDGTAIDVDGLMDGTDTTQTAIGTAGLLTAGVGALVGAGIGAENGYPYAAPSVADLLTGKGRLHVEYLI